MGYPMTYKRVVARNQLERDYNSRNDPLAHICGDLRRLEKDQRDDKHLVAYAMRANITVKQAKAVLDMFFGDESAPDHG